jgi:two-component system cell cycle response regulator
MVTIPDNLTMQRSEPTMPKFLGENVMNRARAIFLHDIGKKIGPIQTALARLEADGADCGVLDILYRFAHTLSGSGKMLELWKIAELAAEIGTVTTLVKDYQVELTTGIREFLKERLVKIINESTIYSDLQLADCSTPPNTIGKKIMIVDDDASVTELLREHLTHNGFGVTVCQDTAAAESQLAVEQPDLIVLDILFPSGDGIEFCRRIRSNPQWAIVPVIFLTVKSELQDKLAGFSTGADDYLCKPFKVEELVARIQAILNRISCCRELVLQDELTKVYNRRYLQMCLLKEISRTERSESCFSVAIVDVDFFKKVNDYHGHLVGDELLQCLVDKMALNLRGGDVICRYGGDEFVILMPDTSFNIACKIMERLRCLFAAELLTLAKSGLQIQLTLSVGVACFPQDAKNGEVLLKKADQALYQAKKAGRNQVKYWSESEILPGEG